VIYESESLTRRRKKKLRKKEEGDKLGPLAKQEHAYLMTHGYFH